MSIVFRMAGVAGRSQRHFEDGLDVTIRAGYFAVSTEQSVVSICIVIEGRLRP